MYPCECEKCHGYKIQPIEIIETHHRKYGRDRHLEEPLLVSVSIIDFYFVVLQPSCQGRPLFL